MLPVPELAFFCPAEPKVVGPVSDVVKAYVASFVVADGPLQMNPRLEVMNALSDPNPDELAPLRFTSPEPEAMTLPAPSGAMVMVNAPGPSTAFAVCGRMSVEMVAATNKETLAAEAAHFLNSIFFPFSR